MDRWISVLATAEILVHSNDRMTPSLRALVDSGAQINLISMSFVSEHDLDIEPDSCLISGIGGWQETLGFVKLDVLTKNGIRLKPRVKFHVVPKIVGSLPSAQLLDADTQALPFSKLADPRFSTPGPVDALLGVELYACIMKQGVVQIGDGLIAMDTKLGWLIMGTGRPAEDGICLSTQVSGDAEKDESIVQPDGDDALDEALRQLWAADQVEYPSNELKPDELWCEEYFEKTCYRDQDGRYTTSLSIRPENLELGESYCQALKRFKALERRLQRDTELASKYVAFMREYENLGHMRVADKLPSATKQHYYIPHHAVLKKFRVVFDASMKTSNSKSLNDIQLPGCKKQADLYDTIMRFRSGRIALTADVVKMFRQVRVTPDQWDLQRIFWRESPQEELKEYWLTVITYGLTSAGYNAVKAMIKCVLDNKEQYPIAAKIVTNSFYMDDMLASVDTSKEAKNVYLEVTKSLATGGFELSKWASNDREVIAGEGQQSVIKIDGDSVSVLGLVWEPESDSLKFNVKLEERKVPVTKRVIASQGAKLFDPNGYITPITIRSKIFMQNLWRIGVGWDDELEPHVIEEWERYYASLEEVQQIRIPRWVGISPDSQIQLHAFCDASAKAYGAVIYVRCEMPNGEIYVSLLTSKSKVADLRTVSIPRLELCAAKLAADMIEHCHRTMNLSGANSFYWTDSEIVLYWLRKFPAELKVFVGNRVSSIQGISMIGNWGHIESLKNPADLISRGVSPAALKESSLWWNGPEFLAGPKEKWPVWKKGDPPAKYLDAIGVERRSKPENFLFLLTRSPIAAKSHMTLLERFDKLSKAVRVTAYVMRFGLRCRASAKTRDTSAPRSFPESGEISNLIPHITHVTVDEYCSALTYWIKFTQRLCFAEEIKQLEQGLPITKTSRLNKFSPFLDRHDGLMRMRGRIKGSSLTYDQRHPILLSGETTLAKKLLAEAHEKTLHGGNQLGMQYIRDKYWIIGLRSAMRKYVRNCVNCAMQRRRLASQMMADLPAGRVTIHRPFTHCGVDYAGPLRLKPYKNSRGTKIGLNAYVAIFVCFATKAVHLELVGELTTQAFLGALDRMILRKNHVEHLYSDQGRNFIGAASELARVHELWQSTEVAEDLVTKGITWHFNTPLAPHHGGLWEAAVKSFKYHLYRVTTDLTLTFEEFSTLIVRIEGCLNSRPLVAPTDDPTDLTILTPGHLVTGGQVMKPLGPTMMEIPASSNVSWDKIRRVEEELWHRWSVEYLTGLQKRSKWLTLQENVKVNDLVVLKDNMPPGQWRRGRITAVFPGKDGAVRSVEVRTASGTYRRPVTKLCILPVDASMQECMAK